MAPASGKPLSIPKLEGTDRVAALAEPGASWREYFYYSFAKAWGVLGFAIVDTWIAAIWVQPLQAAPLFFSLAGALYLEFLFFRYLWYRPGPDDSASTGSFHPTWTRPVRFGRWTPEAERVRRGLSAIDPSEVTGPDPSEFL